MEVYDERHRSLGQTTSKIVFFADAATDTATITIVVSYYKFHVSAIGCCTVVWCVSKRYCGSLLCDAACRQARAGKITKKRSTTSIATTTTTPNRTVRTTFNEFVYLWSRNCNPTTMRVWRTGCDGCCRLRCSHSERAYRPVKAVKFK